MMVERRAPTVGQHEWLAPALAALQDAHEQWHDANAAYHDPSAFRRHIEVLVQTLRNVTFRLQSQKAAGPSGFDDWYQAWQTYMRSDPVLRWLNASRIQVTKRGGLQNNSLALVRVIDSYADPRTVLLRLPADTPTLKVVASAIKRIPAEVRRHQAVEVSRRWESDDLPGHELMGALATIWHVLDSLLIYAAEASAATVNEPPADFAATVELPQCMWVTPDRLPLTFEADTGHPYQLEMQRRESPPLPALDKMAKRYRLGVPEQAVGKRLAETARMIHEVSRQIFKRDGFVLPIAMLISEDRKPWEHVGLHAEDKRDKFMMWRSLGHYIFHRGTDSFIHTGESWAATLSPEFGQYTEASQLPGRREFVMTHFESSDGTVGMWASEIRRPLGRRMLRKAEPGVLGFETVASAFAEPIRRAWKARAEISEGRHERRSAIPHGS